MIEIRSLTVALQYRYRRHCFPLNRDRKGADL